MNFYKLLCCFLLATRFHICLPPATVLVYHANINALVKAKWVIFHSSCCKYLNNNNFQWMRQWVLPVYICNCKLEAEIVKKLKILSLESASMRLKQGKGGMILNRNELFCCNLWEISAVWLFLPQSLTELNYICLTVKPHNPFIYLHIHWA